MKRIISLSVIFSAVVVFHAFSQETFTLTTYYPAPFGVYTELRSKRMAIGDNYYQQNVHPWVTTSPTGGQIGPDVDLVVEEKVGIGAINPLAKLEVRGEAVISKDLIDKNDLRYKTLMLGPRPDGIGVASLGLQVDATHKGVIEYNAVDGMDGLGIGSFNGYINGVDGKWIDNPPYGIFIARNNNVGIGTTSPQAKLDIKSTTSGFLPPRMTRAERDAIAAVEGMTIYNLDAHKLQVYTPTGWQNVGGGLGVPDYDSGWKNWATTGPGNKVESRLTHNLGTTNVLVYLESKDTDGCPPVQEVQGIWQVGTDYSDFGGSSYDTHTVLFWQQLTSTQILVSGILDPKIITTCPGNARTQIIDQFRLRMWKIE